MQVGDKAQRGWRRNQTWDGESHAPIENLRYGAQTKWPCGKQLIRIEERMPKKDIHSRHSVIKTPAQVLKSYVNEMFC